MCVASHSCAFCFAFIKPTSQSPPVRISRADPPKRRGQTIQQLSSALIKHFSFYLSSIKLLLNIIFKLALCLAKPPLWGGLEGPCFYLNNLIALYKAIIITSISSLVLYIAKLALVVPGIPKRFINGCVQW